MYCLNLDPSFSKVPISRIIIQIVTILLEIIVRTGRTSSQTCHIMSMYNSMYSQYKNVLFHSTNHRDMISFGRGGCHRVTSPFSSTYSWWESLRDTMMS